MERHDRLYENYEDALFALLMDQVAEEEGARLFAENERLKNDPAAEVPESFDRVSRETIRRAFSGRRHRSTTRRFGRTLGKLAVAILAALLLLVGSVYAFSPSARVRILNLLIESSNVASRLSVVEDDEDSGTAFSEGDTLMGYQLPPLSKGYAIVDSGQDRHGAWIEYANGQGSIIRIDIQKSYIIALDTENVDFSEIVDIRGYSGKLIQKNNMINISWNDSDTGNLLSLACVNVDKSFVLTYANDIAYIGQ